MLTIYHIEGRRSERAAWLLEELGVPYQLEFKVGDPLGSIQALDDVHVMRAAPVLRDGDLLIQESGAILEYILLKHGNGRFRPKESSSDFARYLEFMHFAEGSAMARMLIDVVVRTGQGPETPPHVMGNSGKVMKFCEARLGEAPYFAGDEFTAADIMMHFPMKIGPGLMAGRPASIKNMQRLDHDYLDAYPNIKAFLTRVQARPAFERAMKSTMPAGPPAF